MSLSKLYEFSLDIKKQDPSLSVGTLVAGDRDSNLLKIKLVDAKATYDLTDKQISIVFHKADDTTVMQSTEDEDSPIMVTPTHEILCTLKANSFACYGQLDAEVVVRTETTVLTSQPFSFWVREPLGGDDTVSSTNEFPILLQILQAEEDRVAVEEQRVLAEGFRRDAEVLREEAERDRDDLRIILEDTFLDVTIEEGSPWTVEEEGVEPEV